MNSTPDPLTLAPLTFAVPKGRILDEALPVMARAGVEPEDGFFDLIPASQLRLYNVRARDE